ncbi:MAG: substrate-binding domain-containing protein [Myxococcota bacterium]
MEIRSQVRERRTALGLSQAELASRLGVSRQALSAIEAGRQVPATTLALKLARALGSTVEELFQLDRRLSVIAPEGTTGRVVVGRVDGRLVAHRVGRETDLADGALLGPDDVDLWSDPAHVDATVLVAGCAPLLGLLVGRLSRRFHDVRGTWVSSNSTEALAHLSRRTVHIAGIHLAGETDRSTHAKIAARTLPGEKFTLVNLARWKQGLVVARGNPKGIRSVQDLLRSDLRCVVRDEGAGAQRLLVRLLGWELSGVRAEDHAEVARLVRWGVADVGVAVESVALAEGLDFIPLAAERFDLVVPNSRLALSHVRRLLELIDTPTFRREASRLDGYDLSTAGHASS